MDPCPRVRTNGVGAGELRGNGAFVVAPPSIHPSGAVYEWIAAPLGKLQSLNLRDLDLAHLGGKLSFGGMLQSQRSKPSQQSNHKQAEVVSDRVAIRNAIAATIPIRPGERNRALFELARRLKGIVPDASTDMLVSVFDE